MKSFSIVGLAVAVTLLTTQAVAQDGVQLEEVVVTATKREQTLQDVPVAVTVTTGETIARAAVRDVSDLASLVPSLRVSQLQTSTNTNFIIRGFGNGANNPGIEPSVGVFIDGVYRSRSAGSIGDLVDVQRVEVLRGPQSTLFGQNASAGVISVVTQQPDFEWGGFIEGGFGNYDERVVKGKVTGPLTDTLAFSVTGSMNKRDGYFVNLTNNDKLNDRDRRDLRAQLLWNASENTTVRLIADKSELDEVCCGVSNLLNGPTGALVQSPAFGNGKIYPGTANSPGLPFDRKAFLNKNPVTSSRTTVSRWPSIGRVRRSRSPRSRRSAASRPTSTTTSTSRAPTSVAPTVTSAISIRNLRNSGCRSTTAARCADCSVRT